MNSVRARIWRSMFAAGIRDRDRCSEDDYSSFSTQLDPRKAWYALNDNLCVIPPRKFCANGIFDLFPEEVCRVNNIDDLRSENGGLVPLASFNRGARGSDTIYAGTAFAVLAGNLRRKDPCEGEFLNLLYLSV